RDNMKFDLKDCVQRGHNFAIVDEVDSILIDEARTPLIISGASEESTDKYLKVNRIFSKLEKIRFTFKYLSVDSSLAPEMISGEESTDKYLKVNRIFSKLEKGEEIPGPPGEPPTYTGDYV